MVGMPAGGQYSTNLDRNRYGNDDNYLFTGMHTLCAVALLSCLRRELYLSTAACFRSRLASAFGPVLGKHHLDSHITMLTWHCFRSFVACSHSL